MICLRFVVHRFAGSWHLRFGSASSSSSRRLLTLSHEWARTHLNMYTMSTVYTTATYPSYSLCSMYARMPYIFNVETFANHIYYINIYLYTRILTVYQSLLRCAIMHTLHDKIYDRFFNRKEIEERIEKKRHLIATCSVSHQVCSATGERAMYDFRPNVGTLKRNLSVFSYIAHHNHIYYVLNTLCDVMCVWCGCAGFSDSMVKYWTWAPHSACELERYNTISLFITRTFAGHKTVIANAPNGIRRPREADNVQRRHQNAKYVYRHSDRALCWILSQISFRRIIALHLLTHRPTCILLSCLRSSDEQTNRSKGRHTDGPVRCSIHSLRKIWSHNTVGPSACHECVERGAPNCTMYIHAMNHFDRCDIDQRPFFPIDVGQYHKYGMLKWHSNTIFN